MSLTCGLMMPAQRLKISNNIEKVLNPPNAPPAILSQPAPMLPLQNIPAVQPNDDKCNSNDQQAVDVTLHALDLAYNNVFTPRSTGNMTPAEPNFDLLQILADCEEEDSSMMLTQYKQQVDTASKSSTSSKTLVSKKASLKKVRTFTSCSFRSFGSIHIHFYKN